MSTLICRDIHNGPGQLGLTFQSAFSADIDLEPGTFVTDHYRLYVLTATSLGLTVTLPASVTVGHSVEISNSSPFSIQVSYGGDTWMIEAFRSRPFAFVSPNWVDYSCSQITTIQRSIKMGFGYSYESFAANERAYVGLIDPGQYKELTAVAPNDVDDAENFAYYDIVGSYCHFNFRVKKGAVYAVGADWFDPAIAQYTFVIRAEFPRPFRSTAFSSTNYSYSFGVIPGDDPRVPRDLTGLILEYKGEPNQCFIIYTYYGQRTFVGDITQASADVDYTFTGSGTYRIA
jgi:hypothetical protein